MARTPAVREKDLIDKILDAVEVKGLSREEVLGQGGLLKQLTDRLLNRILEAEMGEHLGYEENSNAGGKCGDRRNGHSEKAVLTENQSAVIKVPRDRNGTFEPQIIPKYEKRVPLFNDRLISMYGWGMSEYDIKAHLEQMYHVAVSPELISRVTNAGKDDVIEWRNRPLDKGYAVVYLDALRVNARQDGKGCIKSVSVALGVKFAGKKEVLGLWIAEPEGATFWMGVLNELKNRGVEDMLIACMGGLSGCPDAVRAVFPQTRVQLCIVHMVRNSTKFVSYKDQKKP